MQTFLPYEDFARSAAVLDRARLGRQRSEALLCLRVLLGLRPGSPWARHPVARMWAGHETWLAAYMAAICGEWVSRGYRDGCLGELLTLASDHEAAMAENQPYPSWLGDMTFHLSHQSNLVRKNPAFYGPLFTGVPDDLPYAWPVR